MSGTEWVDVIIKLTAIGGGIALGWKGITEFFKSRVQIAKEQSVGATALDNMRKELADTREEVQELRKQVQHWDGVIQRFLNFLDRK